MCMRWKNRHFAAIVRRQQERKKNLAFFSFTRGKRGAFSSPLSLSFGRFANRSSSSWNPSSSRSARREFKVSPIVPEAGVRRGGKRRTRRSRPRRWRWAPPRNQGQCHGGDEAFVCKTAEVPHTVVLPSAPHPFLPFFPPFFYRHTVIGNTLLSALGQTRAEFTLVREIDSSALSRSSRPVLFHKEGGDRFLRPCFDNGRCWPVMGVFGTRALTISMYE